MRREKKHDILASLLRVFCQLRLNVLSKSLNQAAVGWPAVNHTPLDGAGRRLLVCLALKPMPPLPQLIQAAPGRRARVLGVLSERDGPPPLAIAKPVLKQLVIHLLSQGIGISESDIWLVRRRFGGDLVEDLAHLGVLVFRPFPNRRSTTNGGILLLNLRRSSFRNEGP